MSQYVKDLLERVVMTFLQAFVGALVIAVPDGGISLSTAQAAALAGVAAVLSLVKGLLAKGVTEPDNASLVV